VASAKEKLKKAVRKGKQMEEEKIEALGRGFHTSTSSST